MYPAIIAPSILAGNHAHLGASLELIEKAGAPWVHIDIMDGHFVPNLSFGPAIVEALKANSRLYFDVHLMLDNPQHFIDPFIKAGAQNITIHVEPSYPILESLKHIRSLGANCGIALNPDTPCESILPFLEHVDMVLLMTVQPGFGGQSFKQEVLSKIEAVATFRARYGLQYRIEVDGGIDANSAPLCKARGADTFVVGTSFFKAKEGGDVLRAVLG